MTFVDDVRLSFDAANFCATLTAAVGTGRATTNFALRDTSAVSLATTTLQNFHNLATQPGPPDVVAAYVQYSGRATEIFTTLRAVSSNTVITAAALDCLTDIVHYSLNTSNPGRALEGARSVVKETVKARISLLYNVFVHDRFVCAKKALNLLRLVAQCHLLLGREIVSRLNFASEHLAPALCSVDNNFCRVPFLDLVFVLLASGDRDIASVFATTARPVIEICLNVIADRTLSEAGVTRIIRTERRDLRTRKKALTPGHVQKRELIAAINFLLAIERHLIAISSVKILRTALAYPIITHLVEISAAEMPSMDVVPEMVVSDHRALRDIAKRIFATILGKTKVSVMMEAVDALLKISASSSSAALSLIMDIIEGNSKIPRELLERGPYLKREPHLSSSWFSDAAIVSACVLRLTGPLQKFLEEEYFEKCLQHDDSLVRHTGVLVLRAYCKVIAADETARRTPLKFLPRISIIEDLVKKEGRTDEEAQKLLADYQTMLYDEVMDDKHDLIRMALENAGEDLVKAEAPVRSAIRVDKRNAFHSLLRKKYFSRFVICARRTKDFESRRRLWFLCRDIVKCSDLFPPGSEPEVDIFLAYLSDGAKDLDECVADFEQMLHGAWQTPYGLFDDIAGSHPDLTQIDRVSLLSAAGVFRLRKLNNRQRVSKLCEKDSHFRNLLSKMLRTVAACQGLLGTGIDGTYLRSALSKLLHPEEVWWQADFNSSSREEVVIGDCEMIQGVLVHSTSYPHTPFLQVIQALSLFRLQTLRARKEVPTENALINHSTVWSAWSEFCRSMCWTETLDITGSSSQNVVKEITPPSFFLGKFLEQLHIIQHGPDLSISAQSMKPLFCEEDYALSVAALLRVTPVHSVRSLLASEAIVILSADRREKTINGQLLSIVQDSLLQAVNCKNSWDVPFIETFLSFVLKTLGSDGKSIPRRKIAPFSLALLKGLLLHEDTGTRIFVRASLSRAPAVEFPHLLDLSLSTASDLSLVLKFFPTLQRSIIAQVSSWTPANIADSISRLLPLLQVVLNPILFTNLKEKVQFKFHKVCGVVLEALAMHIDRLVENGQEDMQTVVEAMTLLGETFLFSAGKLEVLLKLMRSSYQSENGTVFNNLILLLRVLSDKNKEASASIFTDSILVEILTMLALWIDRQQLLLNEPMHMYALKVFQSILQQLRVRKVALYSLTKDITGLEKALSSICSSTLRSLREFTKDLTRDQTDRRVCSFNKASNSEAVILASLNSVKEVLSLDLLLDKAAKRVLVSLSAQGGHMIRLCLRSDPGASSRDVSGGVHATAGRIAEIITAAVKMLPRFGIEEDVGVALSVIEDVFSADLSRFSATMNLSDIMIRDCMQTISQYMHLNQTRNKYQLLDRRAGYFGPVKSQVLPLFESERLESTCGAMIGDCKAHTFVTENGPSSFESSKQRNRKAYDPVFVLHTFLAACSEALKAPGSALLDLGRIAVEGLLSVVITGMACESAEVRALSYACLHSFSEVIGPVFGVPLGSPAALYRYRRQLSFTLTILRNSIHEPMMQVLPLFAVWFRVCMRIALTPSHSAHKTVVHFFLRAPTIDVTDCLGVSYLLRSQEFQTPQQRKSSRLLGLEVLKRGVVTLKDFNAIRKHRLLDVLFMYGGTVFGDDSKLHSETLKVFTALISRDDGTLSNELINRQGMIPWLLPLRTERDESETILSCRIELLQSLASSAPRPAKHLDFVIQFSGALSVLLLPLETGPELLKSSNLLERVIRCCNSIVDLAPQVRKVIDTNVCILQNESPFLKKSKTYPERRIARVVSRQAHVLVALEHYIFVLDSTYPSLENAIDFTSRWTLRREDAMDVCMAHSFIADGLLSQETRKQKLNNIFQPKLYLALAQGMFVCPTVWLAVASFHALQVKGFLAEELVKYADRLPGLLPDSLNLAKDSSFCDVVDEVRPVLINQLILTASLVQKSKKSSSD